FSIMESPAPPRPVVANHRQLDESEIIATIVRLRDRIQERFPASGLSRVATELIAIADEASECIAYIRRPNWPLRVFAGVTIAGMLTILVIAATAGPLAGAVTGFSET